MKQINLETKKIFVAEKLNEVENVSIDFAGQTIFEKLEEGVHYFANPLHNTDEESLKDIKVLNATLEKLRTERKNLNDVGKKLLSRNREKLEEIRKLREQIDSV